MKNKLLIMPLLMCLLVAAAVMNVRAQGRSVGAPPRREVAVTFDDLPVISVTRHDIALYREITGKLLATITTNRIPAIGFVNENKLYENGKLNDERVALLRRWLDAKLELGNHTFSHHDLHATPLDAFQADVIRGEAVTSKLLGEKGMRLRYFRHPFLHTGAQLETKRSFEEFLTKRGYRVAPVTIDNSDWIFAAAYAKAAARGDKEMMRRVAAAYIPYMENTFDYYEKQAVALFGYEIKQVLLLHANALNADHFGELVEMMKRRGYKFVTLDEALTDKAYTSPDAYIGRGGITWLHRWALTAGKRGAFFAGEPTTPDFVMKEAGVSAE